MRQLLLILSVLFFVYGCQQGTVPQSTVQRSLAIPTDVISAKTWLATTDMPKMVDSSLTADEVAYVLRKTGYEPAPDEIQPWVGSKRSALVSDLLKGLSTPPILDPPEWTRKSVRYWGHDEWPESRRSAFRSARQQEIAELRQWWLSQMLATPSPMAERMVMFWENTFVAGFSGLHEKSHAQWNHHDLIRMYGATSYADLLSAMLRDPAVLIYLDNNNNRKGAPNENLARELLELFTLGESNYSESDVKEAARALAGWHVSEFGELSFQVNPWAQDRSNKSIFGKRGNFNGDDLAGLILQHPAASKHVSRRLWSEFISTEEPPPSAIDQFSDAFVVSGYRIDALLEVMLNSDYFWDRKYRATSVKSPVELMVGSIRASKLTRLSLQQIDAALASMGQTLFDPPDVSGWGYGEYWLDPSFLIERELAMNSLLNVETMTAKSPAKPDSSADNTITVKLAGEAYNGPPQYRLQVQYDGGKNWYSETQTLNLARDTERLGRYKDESEWIWEVKSIDLPKQIDKVEKVGVRFMYDAAGNGGDRNLFVGGIEWKGISFPGAAGTQFPGCNNDKDGAKRHPDRLYCAGTTTLDWTQLSAIAQKQSQPSPKPSPSDLVTRELALLWFTPPSNGGWQSVDLMFDGLGFEDREWGYFGYKFARDERGQYLINIDEERCQPSCFTKWPRDAWKDKAGLRHVAVFARSYDEWSRKQYSQLSDEDKRLVKALFATAPIVLDKINKSSRHREVDSLDTWSERMQLFVDASDSRRLRPDAKVSLIELSGSSSTSATAMSMMNSMDMSVDTGRYSLSSQSLESAEDWRELVDAQSELSNIPLENWVVSISDGESISSLDDWFRNPLINLK